MTCNQVDWLPDLVTLESHGGDWPAFIEAVYVVFKADFLDRRPRWRGRDVGVRREPRSQGKEASFWHATSEGADEDERIPDIRRCERIRWIRALIDSSDDSRLRIWKIRRSNDYRFMIALPDYSYVVILGDRRRYVQFITAFCVEREHRRHKLQKQFEAWQKA